LLTKPPNRRTVFVIQIPAAIVMSPEDIVEASLAGLRMGEVICVPPLDDPSLLTQVAQDQRQLWEHSNGNTISSRYRP
jgi:hypothetical protein